MTLLFYAFALAGCLPVCLAVALQERSQPAPSDLTQQVVSEVQDKIKLITDKTLLDSLQLSKLLPEPLFATQRHAWTNWAGTQYADPAQVFRPKTINDITAMVQKAKVNNKKLRCAGSGHSWSSSSKVNKDGYLAIMNDMHKIHSPVHVGDDVWTVEVETGVTVGDLDEFLRQHSPPLALPSNVVLTSVRYGGVLSLGCHGAATRTRTLPDLIAEVKIVDSNGTLRTFTKDKDPLEFSAATVNLGLLGVIYTYTLRVEPLFKLQMVDSLPLVSEYFDDPKVGGPKLKAMVLGNDQTEMFYWPFNTPGQDAANDYLWLKQWHRTNMTLTSSFVTDRLTAVFQTLQTILGRGVNELMVAYPPSTPHWISFITPLALRADNQVLDAPNAIHYQAGIDNLPCYDLEMGFKVDGNFENVVKAWKFVIDKVYEYASKGKFPMNFPLEMRFVKSSDALMSAAYDEDPEAIYCMIEILSAVRTPGFEEFSIEIGKYWMDNFHARPHWAKMWEHVPGIVPYLRQEAGSRFDKFDAIRKKYDPNDMFLTDTFSGVLGH